MKSLSRTAALCAATSCAEVDGRCRPVSRGAETGGFDDVNRKAGKQAEFKEATRPGRIDPCACR
jgi:hypothetical protein